MLSFETTVARPSYRPSDLPYGVATGSRWSIVSDVTSSSPQTYFTTIQNTSLWALCNTSLEFYDFCTCQSFSSCSVHITSCWYDVVYCLIKLLTKSAFSIYYYRYYCYYSFSDFLIFWRCKDYLLQACCTAGKFENF